MGTRRVDIATEARPELEIYLEMQLDLGQCNTRDLLSCEGALCTSKKEIDWRTGGAIPTIERDTRKGFRIAV